MEPRLWDVVRGLANERRLRGSTDELIASSEYKDLLDRAQALINCINLDARKIESPLDWPLIGWGTYRWNYDRAVLAAVLQKGYRMIDTAEGYGYGRVEQALSHLGAEVLIASKVARTHLSYDSVIRATARIRERLGRVDLLQIHWPNSRYLIDDTLRAMSDTNVPYIGVCNFSVGQLAAAIRTGVTIVSNQVRFNLMDREIESYLLPWCRDHGVRVIAYSPLGQDFQPLAARLRRLRLSSNLTLAQVALGWVISHPGVTAIPATNSIAHVQENLDAQPLDPDFRDYLSGKFPCMI